MFKSSRTLRATLLGAALVALTAACESTQSSHSTSTKPSGPSAGSGEQAAPTQPAQPPPAQAATVSKSTSGWPSMKGDGAMGWSAMAVPTGDARTSAVGVEKGMPREVRMGANFDYQLVITNLTSSKLDDVVVKETLGPGMKLVGSTPEAKLSGDSLTWILGDMAPNEKKVIKLTASPTKEGSLSSCAEVEYNTKLCSSVAVTSPKLKLTKQGPAEVLRCDEITYTFEVANTGTGTIPNVKVSDTLPAGLAAADGRKVLEFNVGNLAAGQSKSLTAKVKAEKTGKYENKATAVGDGGVQADSNVVATTVRQPALKITKNCPAKAYGGTKVDYEITVTNVGDAEARQCTVEDQLPGNCTVNSASDGGKAAGGRVTWDLGTLAVGASKKLTLSVTPQAMGMFRNTAVAKAYCADAVSAACETDVQGLPALLLEVVDLTDPVKVGAETVYEITVTNQGTATDTNIRVWAELHSSQSLVSATGPTANQVAGGKIGFDPLAKLAPKEKVTYRVTVKGLKPANARFKVAMISTALDPENVEETEATQIYE
jgi:uncharacterized repeat protein (TIGR01451 family)